MDFRIQQFKAEATEQCGENIKVVYVYGLKKEADLVKSQLNKVYRSKGETLGGFPLGKVAEYYQYVIIQSKRTIIYCRN